MVGPSGDTPYNFCWFPSELLVFLVVCGRAPWGIPYHFLWFPSDLLVFLLVLAVFAQWLSLFLVGSSGGSPYHFCWFPSDLLVFGGVGGFGCFCLMFVVVCGKAPWGIPYHFLWFPSDLLVFLLVWVVCAYWFSLLLVGSSGAPPTISVDFHQICSCLVVLVVLAVCLVVLVVCGRALWVIPYQFLWFPSDLLVFLLVLVVFA